MAADDATKGRLQTRLRTSATKFAMKTFRYANQLRRSKLNCFSLPLVLVGAVAAVNLATPGAVRAQTTYYWKGGAGTWDTTTANWYPQAAATSGTAEAFASGTTSIARIGTIAATAGTITLGTAITAQELDIDNVTGYTIASGTGTPALTLATGNINSNFLSGNTATTLTTTISAPLAGTDINVSASGTAGSTLTTSFGNTTVALGGTNTFTGNLNLGAASSGTGGTGINRVNILAAAALPTTATVRYLNTNTSVSINGGGVATLGNNFVLNPNGTYTAGTFTAYLGATSGNGLVANGTISGNGDLVFAAGINGGAGIVTLNSANTYAGSTTLSNSSTGVIRLGVNNALPTTTALTFGDGSANNFGALDLNGKSQTVSSLRTNLAASQTATGVVNTNTSTGATLTVNGTASTTYASTIGSTTTNTNLTALNANISLVKAGSGTLTLSGVNPYTGSTMVSAGTLLISGSINGSPSVQISGTGALTLNNATALSDAGTLSLTSGTTLNLNAASGTSETVGSLVLDGTAEAPGTYNALALMGLDSSVSFNSLNGETLTVVPEPTTILGGLLLLSAAGWTLRRRVARGI